MYFDPVVDLPLRCFKEKLGVLTLFEGMEKLEKYFHITPLEDIQNEFKGDLDLDGVSRSRQTNEPNRSHQDSLA